MENQLSLFPAKNMLRDVLVWCYLFDMELYLPGAKHTSILFNLFIKKNIKVWLTLIISKAPHESVKMITVESSRKISYFRPWRATGLLYWFTYLFIFN